jgi:hypothetical protein
MRSISENLKESYTNKHWTINRRKLLGAALGATAATIFGTETIKKIASDSSSPKLTQPSLEELLSEKTPSPQTESQDISELSIISKNGSIEFSEAPLLNGIAEMRDWNIFLDIGQINRIIYSSSDDDITLQISVNNIEGTVDPFLKITSQSLDMTSKNTNDDDFITKGVDYITPLDNLDNPKRKFNMKLFPAESEGSILTISVNDQEYSRRLLPPQYIYPSTDSEVILVSDTELGPEKEPTLNLLISAKTFITENQLSTFLRRPLSDYGIDVIEDQESTKGTPLVLTSQEFADQVSSIARSVAENIGNLPKALKAWKILEDRFEIVRSRLLEKGIQLINSSSNKLENPKPISLAEFMFSKPKISDEIPNVDDQFDVKLVTQRFIENIILDPKGWEEKFKQLNYSDPTTASRSDKVIVSYIASAIYNLFLAVDPEKTRKFLPALQPWSNRPDETWIKLGQTHVFDTDANTEFLLREIPTAVPRPSAP